MARQKMISISKLGEIIDLMKAKGVESITIPDTAEIRLYAFAVNSIEKANRTAVDFSLESSENEMTDDELLLHSAR